MGSVMFFLLRMGFWLTVVCVLLPSSGAKTSPDANIDAVQAVSFASAAMSDARGFCDRQPDACVVGGKVATAIGHKAEAGARTIYEFISTKLNDKSPTTETVATRNDTTASAKVVPVSAAGAVGPMAGHAKGTLTPSDLQPAWHAPVPLPPRREARNNRPAA
jgi:Family of unknown function (DUF5330)